MYVLNNVLLHWKPFIWSIFFLILACISTKFATLPISGFYLLGYVIILIVLSTWGSFMAIQTLLQQNKPTEFAKFLKLDVKHQNEKLDFDNSAAIQQLSVDIDRYFIEKWFIYISKDPSFNEESRQLLEETLRKIVNVQLSLDNGLVIHGVLNLYLKHLKEFRRSLKRREKYSGKISDLYRYSHPCSTSTKAKNYFMHQLTINLLNHFINWELGNSLPYQILVSIISKKVMTYILNLLSDPEFVNYYILTIFATQKKKQQMKLSDYNRVKIMQISEKDDGTPTDMVKSLSKTNLENLEVQDISEIDGLRRSSYDYGDIKSEDVKIYEPKSCKSWYDSLDYASVPLGQDILDTISLSGSDRYLDLTVTTDPEKDETLSPMTSAKNLFDEMKHEVKQMTSLEGLKTSMKPISDATATTFHNIKDLQESTVNNVVKPMSQATSTALHKIGGLHLQDEAAGVVEGILDFGRARIRKGLRLTGLQDSPPEEAIKPPQHKKIMKIPHVKSDEIVTEQPAKVDVISKIPSIQTHEEGSPEPEYEETADLATSIAKLRSLLEQKSSESNLSTPALSPMPTDEQLAAKIEMGETEDGDETDGVMPSFYKLCAKTATGVIHNTLNTIKTALPGNVADCDRFDGAEKWLFVEANTTDSDLNLRMQKLLTERKIFCTVDSAYEAIDSLGSLQPKDNLHSSDIQFEDELDDFEGKLPITKALCDIFCELLADTKDTSLTQEPVIKSFLLLFGNYVEENVISRANYFLHYACANSKIPTESQTETLLIELEEFIDVVMEGIQDSTKYLISEKTLRDAINLFVSSLQVQKINQDLVMQIFEIVCMKLMDGSKQL